MHIFFKINIFVLCFSTLSHAEKIDKEILVNVIFDRFQEMDELVPVSKHKFAQAYDLETLKKMKISQLKDLDSKTSKWSDPDTKLSGRTSLARAFEIGQALMADEIRIFKANKTTRQAEAGCPRIIALYGWKIDAFRLIQEYLETLSGKDEFIDQNELRTMKNEFSEEQFLSSIGLFEELKKSCEVYLPRDEATAGYIESVKEITGYFVAGSLSIYVVRQFVIYWYGDRVADFYKRLDERRAQRKREQEKKDKQDRKKKGGQNPGPRLAQDPQVPNPKSGIYNQGCMRGQLYAQSVPHDAEAQRLQEERRAAKIARKEAEQERQAEIARETAEAKRAEIALKKAEDLRQAEIERKKYEDRLAKNREDREREAEIVNAANHELAKYIRLINDVLTDLNDGNSDGLANLGAIIASITKIDCSVLTEESKKALKAIWSRLDQVAWESDFGNELRVHRGELEQHLIKKKII